MHGVMTNGKTRQFLQFQGNESTRHDLFNKHGTPVKQCAYVLHEAP